MNGLNRHLAPLSEVAWKRIESEACEVLELHLAARRIFDFHGPLGWDHSAVDLGRIEELPSPPPHARAILHRRVVRPLVELRVPFSVDRRELDRIERGASAVELEPLREAARVFAATEDSALFDGNPEAGIVGLRTGAAHDPIEIPADGVHLPDAVSRALEQLRQAGVAGPYGLALGPRLHAELTRTAGDGGYPIVRHVQRLLDRPVIWAPSLAGGLVASLRGGDFKLVCGRDVTIGYTSHDEKEVRLYLEESFTAEVSEPDAAVPLELSP